MKKREKWRSKIDFFFAIAGSAVGLGNVWRFPYLCYKNGGGAFLVPYLFFLIVAALPIFFLEVTVGQLTSRGVAKAWEIVPLMKGLGFASTVLTVNINTYYMIVLAWALRYTVASFSNPLPWGSCDNEWNTDNCYTFEHGPGKNSTLVDGESIYAVYNSSATSVIDETVEKSNESNRISSVMEFWERGVLGKSSGIHDIGSVQLQLLACTAIGWVVVYFSIWKGIKWTSKVVYFTATFPLVMMLILFIRGVTLPGAMDGVAYYLKPNATKLLEARVWTDAATQVFYSYALCTGVLIALGSYNTYHHNSYRDSILLAFLNSGTSFFSGFVVFAVLGYMAKEQSVEIDTVAESGPGLVFIAYPRAISLLPFPQLWGILFFLMLFFLGLDGQFVSQESFITSLADMWPGFFQKPRRREIAVAIICCVQFLFGILMITEGGIYVFTIYDNYAAAGWCILFIGICECITISWIFGINKYWDIVVDMLQFRPKIPYFKYSWTFLAPVSTTVVFIYHSAKYTGLTYDKTYQYPFWADILGWCLALSAMLWIPGYAIYVIWNAEGSLREKWTAATSIPKDVQKRIFREDKCDNDATEKLNKTESLDSHGNKKNLTREHSSTLV